MMDLTLLTSLLIAHLLADFYLQPATWVRNKFQYRWRGYALWLHSGVHALLTCAVILLIQSPVKLTTIGIVAVVVFVSHAAIDGIKASLSNKTRYFVGDQIAHLLVLFGIAWLIQPFTTTITGMVQSTLSQYPQSLAVFCGYLLMLKPAAILISQLLKRWTPIEELNADTSLPQAGELIGMLERLLILTFVLLGQWSGVGFLLAAKSVFRFGDLAKSPQRKLTEYVMLGTLISVSIAVFTGLGLQIIQSISQ